jgi:hypothetical protein
LKRFIPSESVAIDTLNQSMEMINPVFTWSPATHHCWHRVVGVVRGTQAADKMHALQSMLPHMPAPRKPLVLTTPGMAAAWRAHVDAVCTELGDFQTRQQLETWSCFVLDGVSVAPDVCEDLAQLASVLISCDLDAQLPVNTVNLHVVMEDHEAAMRDALQTWCTLTADQTDAVLGIVRGWPGRAVVTWEDGRKRMHVWSRGARQSP